MLKIVDHKLNHVDHKFKPGLLLLGGIQPYDLPSLALWSTSISYDIPRLNILIYFCYEKKRLFNLMIYHLFVCCPPFLCLFVLFVLLLIFFFVYSIFLSVFCFCSSSSLAFFLLYVLSSSLAVSLSDSLLKQKKENKERKKERRTRRKGRKCEGKQRKEEKGKPPKAKNNFWENVFFGVFFFCSVASLKHPPPKHAKYSEKSVFFPFAHLVVLFLWKSTTRQGRNNPQEENKNPTKKKSLLWVLCWIQATKNPLNC